jgi:hypothetical protein
VRQAWTNLLAVLAAANMEMCDLAKVIFYLTKESDYAAYAALRGELLGAHKPASTPCRRGGPGAAEVRNRGRSRWLQYERSASRLIAAQLQKSGGCDAESAMVCGNYWFGLSTGVSLTCRKALGSVWRSRLPDARSNYLSHVFLEMAKSGLKLLASGRC